MHNHSALCAIILALCTTIGGCATTQPVQRVVVRTDISCKLLRPRDWSVLDTLTSIQYRRQDNAAACTCPENKNKPECKA